MTTAIRELKQRRVWATDGNQKCTLRIFGQYNDLKAAQSSLKKQEGHWTGAEMRPSIVSGIVTRDAPVGQLLANVFTCPCS